MKFSKLMLILVLFPVQTVVGQAQLSDTELRDLLKIKIRTVQHMALNPTMVRAVRRQNSETLSVGEIKERDKNWSGTDELTTFKRSLQENTAGRFLRRHVSREDASFNEAFLTDNQGANVAAYPATSDYWQGDEDKWAESFNEGEGQVFLGDLELDESTQTYAVQVSAPVLDRGRTIGVLVVGVTLDYLEDKQVN